MLGCARFRRVAGTVEPAHNFEANAKLEAVRDVVAGALPEFEVELAGFVGSRDACAAPLEAPCFLASRSRRGALRSASTTHMHLMMNIHSGFVHFLGHQVASNNTTSLSAIRRFIRRLLPELLCWPAQAYEVDTRLKWTMFLNCGPMLLYRQATSEQPPLVADETQSEEENRVPVFALRPGKCITASFRRGDLWRQQDEAWLEELKAEMSLAPAQFLTVPDSHVVLTGTTGLLTYSPMLPLLLVGPTIVKAAPILLERDRLFALSVFFGIPLIDRTRTLMGPMKTVVMDSIPSRTETNTFCKSLEEVMLARAQELLTLAKAQGKRLQVMWSGGIDSTALLVALIRVCRDREERDRWLVVQLDDSSIHEYPQFYEDCVKELPNERLDGKSVSKESIKADRITVTGECGDQLFGSMLMKKCFEPTLTSEESDLPLTNHFAKGLDAPWQHTLLPSLRDRCLLAGTEEEWEAWIAPQLAKSPIDIVSTFDMLWWLNYSMKWQQVCLRSLHNAYTSITIRRDSEQGWHVLDGIEHFYRARSFELWCLKPENHSIKFRDRTAFATYKEPLKKFILDWNQDELYYNEKLKVGSLFREDEVPAGSALMAITCHGEAVHWGRHSLCHWRRDLKYGSQLVDHYLSSPWKDFVEQESIKLRENTTRDKEGRMFASNVARWSRNGGVEVLQPAKVDISPSTFEKRPGFYMQDERQHRLWNPITRLTLKVKCEALLPERVVQGRSVADLGACLGAMCEWSLSRGATRAVAVEVQPDLASRARDLLSHWGSKAEVRAMGVREFLKECTAGEYGVVIAAGVMHCFPDPLNVLLEAARVASHAVVIESIHPECHQRGIFEEDEGCLEQFAPNALVNLAGGNSLEGMAMVPSLAMIQDVMMSIGFDAYERVYVEPHPQTERNREVAIYTRPNPGCVLPQRFFVRFLRCDGHGHKAPIDLEMTLKQHGKGGRVRAWDSKPLWFRKSSQPIDSGQTGAVSAEDLPVHTDADLGRNGEEEPSRSPVNSAAEPRSNVQEPLNSYPVQEENPAHSPHLMFAPVVASLATSEAGTWEFDERVAARFDSEADNHIPDYRQTIQLSAELVRNRHGRRSCCLDVGSATGNTLIMLQRAGIENIQGVDNSLAMVKASRERLPAGVRVHFAHEFPEGIGAPLDAVIANWTLHFMKPDRRREYLTQIFHALSPGGTLILSEKTKQTEEQVKLYYMWKAHNGIPLEEIEAKRRKLIGVLIELPQEWYHQTLLQIGFVDVTVVSSRFGFFTWIATKSMSSRPGSCSEENVAGLACVRLWKGSRYFASDDCEGPGNGLLAELVDGRATNLYGWGHGDQQLGSPTQLRLEVSIESGWAYGYVASDEKAGGPTLRLLEGALMGSSFSLRKGMYFSCTSRFHIHGGSGFVVVVHGYKGFFHIGGPIESLGRLPYINGCTDSLLISPPVCGDPCLNHLHFPANVEQTQHTHPSLRCGMVARGHGHCMVPTEKSVDGNMGLRAMPLTEGTIFHIPTGVMHSFHTAEDPMDIIAFHPDSDYGPRPEDHPMVNKTMLNGVSAAYTVPYSNPKP